MYVYMYVCIYVCKLDKHDDKWQAACVCPARWSLYSQLFTLLPRAEEKMALLAVAAAAAAWKQKHWRAEDKKRTETEKATSVATIILISVWLSVS